MKRFVVVGPGGFGTRVAEALHARGYAAVAPDLTADNTLLVVGAEDDSARVADAE